MRRNVALASVVGMAVASHALADIPVYTNDTTRLNIYGRINAAAETYNVDGLNSSTDAEGTRLQSHSSRFGINAGQKISDDLKAVGQYEAGVSLFGSDDGSTPFYTTRNTYIGLASASAGELRVGRHDVAYKMVTVKDNLFPDCLGENDNIISEGAGRADDTMLYLSPKWNDIQLLGSVSLTDMQEYNSDKLTTSSNKQLEEGKVMSAGVQYDGALGFLGVGIEGQESDQITTTNSASGYDSGVLSIGTPKMGGFQIVGALEVRNGTGKADETNYSIGAAQDIGKWTVKGNYGWKDVDAEDANASMITAGVSYRASKALELYAIYTAIDNEDKSKVDYSDGPIGKTTTSSASLTAGDDVSGVALGAVYSF